MTDGSSLCALSAVMGRFRSVWILTNCVSFRDLMAVRFVAKASFVVSVTVVIEAQSRITAKWRGGMFILR
ncbi:hypothetical protein FRC0190_00065 [Corynebacterium rouxii]|uniref:Uncharacterized protein n=1 Tax=Corynebacterium rouxii TaxID=2719119 RepID=A0A6I8MB71_9CORY|nr:hypothetical protein FRC0190_00065 [Corynebacterium rouxii]